MLTSEIRLKCISFIYCASNTPWQTKPHLRCLGQNILYKIYQDNQRISKIYKACYFDFLCLILIYSHNSRDFGAPSVNFTRAETSQDGKAEVGPPAPGQSEHSRQGTGGTGSTGGTGGTGRWKRPSTDSADSTRPWCDFCLYYFFILLHTSSLFALRCPRVFLSSFFHLDVCQEPASWAEQNSFPKWKNLTRLKSCCLTEAHSNK